MYEYTTAGTCSRKIRFDIKDNKVCNIAFEGGCNGNLKGISILAEGMEPKKLIALLKGVDCGGRGTSCPDQLATAVSKALEQR
ncbi:MAG: TIGR03905 family TSCPD domain-containing protein [Spirochaetaceae bacterium]|nr:TIGR03905 family TSCPD domain-containing protein [Spirochaetaceae bacterium]